MIWEQSDIHIVCNTGYLRNKQMRGADEKLTPDMIPVSLIHRKLEPSFPEELLVSRMKQYLMKLKVGHVSAKKPFIMPNNKISVFRVTGLKILGRVGTYIFFLEI